MTLRRWLLASLALPVIFSFALVACGGDDDDDGATGDDGDNGDNGGGNGSDEDYVADVCGALAEFQASLDGIDDSDIPEDEDEFREFLLEVVGGPLGELVDSLEDANPPADVAEYHDALAASFAEVEADLQAADDPLVVLLSITELDAGAEEPPEAVQARLRAVAEDNEDCVAAGIFLED